MNKWPVFIFVFFMCLILPHLSGAETIDGDFASLKDSLTVEEKNWLREHPVIRVGGPASFPPFHYYDEKGRPAGIGADYAAYIMKTLGVEVRYEPSAPWTEVLEKIKDGRLDVLACAAKSSSREAFLTFSDPYLSFPLVIITRRDESFIGGLKDLAGVKTALIKKVPTLSWLRRDGIDVIPYEVDAPLDALKAVSHGRADALIENLAAASYQIQKNGLFNLKVAAPTSWGNYELYFAVRKDWGTLASIIDKVLAGMSQELKSTINNKWISIRYEFGVSAGDIAFWAAVVLIPVFVFVVFIMFYNHKLRREIVAREKAESEKEIVISDLQTALANIKQLKGLLPICASCKKIRDDKGYWQQVEEYLRERSDAEFSHSICPDCLKKLYPDLIETSSAKSSDKD